MTVVHLYQFTVTELYDCVYTIIQFCHSKLVQVYVCIARICLLQLHRKLSEYNHCYLLNFGKSNSNMLCNQSCTIQIVFKTATIYMQPPTKMIIYIHVRMFTMAMNRRTCNIWLAMGWRIECIISNYIILNWSLKYLVQHSKILVTRYSYALSLMY